MTTEPTAATFDPDAAGDAAGVAASPPVDPAGRYTDRYRIARGGMGEVRAVTDTRLRRGAVMKIVLPHLAQTSAARRLQREAELTGQLQHPGVVPIYDSGVLADGRPFYVMREVRGQTLREAQQDSAGPRGFRRLIGALQRVCETVAYAHSQHIVHRDLKPDNVMLEAFGSVLVLDWGIARRLDTTDELAPIPEAAGAQAQTRAGAVLGTPGYMAPEQAAGAVVGPPCDVFALAVVLSELLAPHPEPPDSLLALATSASDADPARRPTASAMARELEAWMDGARRREEALRAVEEADRLQPGAERMRQEASARAGAATERLRALPVHAPMSEKAPLWAEQDAAEALRQQAILGEHRWEQQLHHALRLEPQLAEAHQRLAAHYRQRHAEASDPADALRLEALLRTHDRGQHATYLRGDAEIALETDPPGAEVVAYRFVPTERRLQPQRHSLLGRTPLRATLPHGSWLLELRHPDRAPVRYPVLLPRGGRWSRTPPGAAQPAPIYLPRAGEIGAGGCYIPAGWCSIGGDPKASDPTPLTRVWVDGLVMQAEPVTVGAYLRFLDALPVDVAEQRQPRQPRGAGPLLVRSGGRWECPDGRSPRLPITHVCWEDAAAYAGWWAEQTGQPWRLPHSVEWEKAARGVDQRRFPWGDFCDATWANLVGATPERPSLTETAAWPLDESLYGVRGLVGNTRDLCHDRYRRTPPGGRLVLDDAGDSPLRLIRGGHYAVAPAFARSAARLVVQPGARYPTLGFRLARSLP